MSRACGTSTKNQDLKSHLSHFALKPTLQRRTLENEVFFLNGVCFFGFWFFFCFLFLFFVITNVGVNGIFGSWSDIVSQVVLLHVGF